MVPSKPRESTKNSRVSTSLEEGLAAAAVVVMP